MPERNKRTRKITKAAGAKDKKLKAKKPLKRAVGKTVPGKKVLKKKTSKPAKGKSSFLFKETVLGTITHYFPKVRVAVVKLQATLSIGERIHIKGRTTDFIQEVSSLQLDHVPISKAAKGKEIGLLVDSRVREHDLVCRAAL